MKFEKNFPVEKPTMQYIHRVYTDAILHMLLYCYLIYVCCFRYSNSFRQYRQGDAHELMRCILDAVRMEEIEVCSLYTSLICMSLYT